MFTQNLYTGSVKVFKFEIFKEPWPPLNKFPHAFHDIWYGAFSHFPHYNKIYILFYN